MPSVVARTFRSTPYRDALRTWEEIVDMLTQGQTGPEKNELLSVSGIVASIIADHCPKDEPIVVTCDGPRTRIYTTYDENALDGTGENENPLGFDPLLGDWAVSVPCGPDDLLWITNALKKVSTRITVRGKGSDVPAATRSSQSQTLTLDPKGFLGI